MMRRLALVAALVPAAASAERPPGVCIDVGVDFTPTDALQIVAWVEKPDGTYVATIFITNKTGRYGLGNRPGAPELNANGPHHDTFPYGRREQTFPVWAHRHGMAFPKVVFQDEIDLAVSKSAGHSSPEFNPPYCGPYKADDESYDSGTCASLGYSDKGMFSPSGEKSLYPPRTDVIRQPSKDSASVDLYRANNPFDAVSKPTPFGGVASQIAWAAPQSVDLGDYVLYVETSKTYDFNATYNLPSPTLPWGDYGTAWRGQPSIVYRVPLAISSAETQAQTDSYVGYGDVDGATGTLHPPDATITTDTPGSGAARFQLVADAGTMYRLRVRAHEELDNIGPAPLGPITVTAVGTTTATLQFVASGDDGMTGTVGAYEIRVRANSPMTAANFAASQTAVAEAVPVVGGALQTVTITGLLPETDYSIGIRPIDNCFNQGDLQLVSFTTADRPVTDVPWCFIATAAYGSVMADDVQVLRRFRDSLLSRTVLGELAVETYYTFSPAMAAAISESDLLRASARAALRPLIAWLRQRAY